jgi:uncharacterized protein YmfQ (DUF2313 family)
MTHLILPSGDTDADRFAREIAVLRGPEVTAADGTVVAEDFRALGGALAGVRSTVLRAVAQAHPGSATDLLDELEAQYGLANGADLTTAARQLRLRAKTRARRQSTAATILATVRTIAPTATLTGVAWNATTGYPRATFRLAIVVPVATFDSSDRATIQALAEQQARAYEEPRVTTRVGFRCDDPLSRCDDTLLAT